MFALWLILLRRLNCSERGVGPPSDGCVWVYERDRVTRYSLAHRLYQGDNGRVVGYDNAHDGHQRQYKGRVEPVDFVSFADIKERFEQDWIAMRNEK